MRVLVTGATGFVGGHLVPVPLVAVAGHVPTVVLVTSLSLVLIGRRTRSS